MIKVKSSFVGLPCLALILLLYTTAYGYEVETHKEMTKIAASLSVNFTSYDFATLGLSSSSDVLTDEGLKCNRSTPASNTALDWIKEGSVCEDDTFTEVFARYKHHFYDPISGRGFGGIFWRDSGFVDGKPAPDWAIDMGPADGQLYSFSQGRQYFFDGLTKPSETERKGNLARMFRTLGDVVHLVQDMAQPQHTRNDGHGLPKSAYEVYTDDNRDSLVYTEAPIRKIRKFATAREYYTDLAQFSNSNFVTAGTNFKMLGGQALPGDQYSSPRPGTPTEVSVEKLNPPVSLDIKAYCGTNTPCLMTFYPIDAYIFNERASTLSIVDQYVGDQGTFTLNRYTFDSAHPFLISRAVAYSAGLIDYFFRGKIDFKEDLSKLGRFVVKNLHPSDALSGEVVLYYDQADATREPLPGFNMSVNAGPEGESELIFPDAPFKNAAERIDDESYLMVFKGALGQETPVGSGPGAVIGKKVKVRNMFYIYKTQYLPYSNYPGGFMKLNFDWIGEGRTELRDALTAAMRTAAIEINGHKLTTFATSTGMLGYVSTNDFYAQLEVGNESNSNSLYLENVNPSGSIEVKVDGRVIASFDWQSRSQYFDISKAFRVHQH